MTFMAVSLAAAAVLLELAIAIRYRRMLAAFRKHAVSGMGASILLSWLLGQAFGASGMVVLFAAVTSTVVTALLYATGVLEGMLYVKDRLSSLRRS